MGKKLYVGNLSWSTTERDLEETFSQAGAVVSAQIPLNQMGRSRGFGFVEMASDEEAQQAIEMFNEKEIDGRVLRVNESGQAPAGQKVNNRKLFVGGLAWATTEDGLRDAFSQAGEVTYVRIPLNDMGRSRGIGFVEMASDEEAQRAIELFDGKELDGRALKVNIARPPAPRQSRDDGDSFGGGRRNGGYRNDYSNEEGAY